MNIIPLKLTNSHFVIINHHAFYFYVFLCYMFILLQSLPEEQKYFSGEIIACDTIINDDQYYLDQYQYVADSISYLWTFSVRFDAETHKFCALSKYGIQRDERMDKDEVLSFLKSVVFDLTPFIKEQ